ncbi:hypothetical protein CBR_g41596 [Chara braunii]|uniref:Reverse transcriptase/retrotransposon-derived protein RNase H-like domain-containing protein n=1 Tax=Chara braunii TaxID=69332 RepID=A0A388LWA6_CHABU|nr:hypothetical protein CBR_g41596 [Chara braunii]|eukprot:GBG86533.1 hypothetical protein CBR_g41596 [Chara braunii]
MSDVEDTGEDDRRTLRSARGPVSHVSLGPEGDRELFRRQRERRARAAEASRAFASEASAIAAMATTTMSTSAQQTSQAGSSGTAGSMSQSTGLMASQPAVLSPEDVAIQQAALQEAQLQQALEKIKREKEMMIRRRARMQQRGADIEELETMDLTHMDDDVKQKGPKLRPVEYMSKKMLSQKLAKSTYEKELYAVFKALTHWRHYLLGRFFILRTDHQTLRWMRTQSVLSDALKRWIEVIEQYDFDPQYLKGEYNKVADALSRRPDFSGALITEFDLTDDVTQSLVEAYRQDQFMSEIICRLEAKDKKTSAEFELVNGLLFLEKAGNKRLCGPQPGVMSGPGQSQWVPKTAIAAPKPFTGDKRGENLDTWLRAVPVYVKCKLTLPHEEVLVAASYLEGSAARWLSGLVQLQGYGHDFRAWAVTQKLDDFLKLVEDRWHDPQEAQKAADAILTLHTRQFKSVSEANINMHNFPSFSKRALDLEAKIGHGHNPTTDGRKKTLPPNWKAKGRIMFVDNDGSTIELDDEFLVGVGSEAGSVEASRCGVVTAVAQKGEKCEFGRTHVVYLGYEISTDGLKPDDAKVANIHDWPRPQSVTEMGSLLGMTGYYRNFVKNYSIVAAPLTDLTRIDTPWEWTDRCEAAFKHLKHALTHHEVLKLPDADKPFIITTDASQYGIGAVLAQQEGKKLRPIEYMSKKMPSQKLAKSTYEKELYAIYKALTHWRHYLLGRFFYVRTDYQTLKWMRTQPVLSDALKRWIEVIKQYDFEPQYIKGEYNKVADALSRRPDFSGALITEFDLTDDVTRSIVEAYRQDEFMYEIIRRLEAKDEKTFAEFELVNDVLFLEKAGNK